MIRIMICCAGGFSSSALTEKVKKEIIEKGLSDQMMAEFRPFSTSYEYVNDFDIIMACPHQNYKAPAFVKEHNIQIPVYLIPPRLYGTMPAEDLLEDAKDIIEGYNKDHRNPWCFPEETSLLRIKRATSHKKMLEGK